MPRTKAQQISLELQKFVLETGVNPVTREIYMFGEVDGGSAYRFITMFREMDRYSGEITISLNSVGGDEYEGCAIFETIRGANNPVIIEAIGACQSIAALILQAAPYRRITKECRFMVHPGSITLGGAVDSGSFASLGDEVKFSHRKYVDLLTERSTKTRKEVEALCSKESYLSADETVEWGFADEIIDTSQKFSLSPPKKPAKPRVRK